MFAHLTDSPPPSLRAEAPCPRSTARRRRTLGVLPLLVGLLGMLVACGGGPDPMAAPPPAPAEADSAPAAQQALPVPERRATSTVAILFERGALARKSDQVLVTPGTTVTLAVTSDVADDIHLHGYNSIAPTVPGGEARLEFAADRPGRYTAEFETRALPLVEFIVEAP